MSNITSIVLSLLVTYCLLADGVAQEAETTDPPRLALEAGGHTAVVKRVLFRPSGDEVLTVSEDKTIRIWDVATGTTLRVLRPPIGDGSEGMLYAAALSPDGTRLAVAGFTNAPDGDNVIYEISLSSSRITQTFKGHSNVIIDLDYSPDGRKLISGSSDKTARIWDTDSGECTQTLSGHTADIYGVVFSPDGRQCASAAYDDTAAIWNVDDGKRTAILKGHADNVYCIDWSPDGRRIATGSYDHTIRLWDQNGQFLRTFDQLGEYNISSVTFTPDSGRLL